MIPTPTQTETADERYAGLDTWEDDAILAALLDGQRRALEAVAPALPALAEAARAAAERLAAGGRLVYLAAGSPALMSLADALELPQTYGIAEDRIVPILSDAGGLPRRLDGSREDSAEAARADVAAAGVGPADLVVAVSASGSTPYTVAGLGAARTSGAATVGIAGNAGAALFEQAQIAVLLKTGPEVISGSTRLGAGTAQKAALNLFSTLVGVRLGHVHDGLMVNVKTDNEKLRLRAARIVQRITGVDDAEAAAALRRAGGAVKTAVLLAAGMDSAEAAEAVLARTGGNLRAALAEVRSE